MITVFGTVPSSNATSSPPTVVFTVDDNTPITITLPLANTDISDQPFFASEELAPNEIHTLLVNVTDASSPFIIARFFVGHPTTTSNVVDMDLPPPSDVVNPIPSVSFNTTLSLQSQLNELQTVKILVGILAGLLIIVMVVVGLIIFHWRRFTKLALSDKESGGRQEEEATRQQGSKAFSFSRQFPTL